ncbi:siderophore-interacting protein [Brevibacterium atlanticum]|uniref:siderophore-interacting protein n=1 Tax=Brevibacterium atlanticum TaxID=2697563 RepID=UPI001423D70B|nr:siderophore-interacting protein [Brevibacterium atlanticum]
MPVNARRALREVMAERRNRVVNCQVSLVGTEVLSAGYMRLTVTGDGLRAYTDPRPGDAFKIYLPSRPGRPVPAPSYDEQGHLQWPDDLDGGRPLVRCFTVRSSDAESSNLTFDVLLHEEGATAQWLAEAAVGDRIGFTGMRTEFVDTAEAQTHLLIGDRSALPAIAAIAESLPDTKRTVVIALGTEADAAALGLPDSAEITFVDDAVGLVSTVSGFAKTDARTQVWIGAEAAVVKEIRRDVLGRGPLSRDAMHASAYWKAGLNWEQTFEESMDRFLAAAKAGSDVGDPGVLQSLAFD